MNKTYWSVDTPKRKARVDISGNGVLVASNCGPGGRDVGAVVSFDEFLAGRYQDLIRKVFGSETLDEMIAAVSRVSDRQSCSAASADNHLPVA